MATVVLTFDNLGEATELERGEWDPAVSLGRHPSVTEALPRLLAVLDRHRLAATFCVEAINCALNPDAVRELHHRGHEVALHGWRHEPWAELAPAAADERIDRSLGAFAELDVPVSGFRPPGGEPLADDGPRLHARGLRWISPAATGGGDAVPAGALGLHAAPAGTPAVDAVPAGAPALDADAAPVRLPFAWPAVDAYWLMDSFADLRARRGDAPAGLTAAGTAPRLRAALDDPDAGPGPRVLVMHPFLMLEAAWAEQVEALLGELAAGPHDCVTAAAAAGAPDPT